MRPSFSGTCRGATAALALISLHACGAVTRPADASVADTGPGGCTGIACVSGYEITLEHPGTWTPGLYQLAIQADGVTTNCQVALPFAGGCSGTPYVRCTPAGAQVQIGESGCALPAAQQGLSSIGFGAVSPTAVRVAITRDAAPLVERAFTPMYTVSRPNGPNCEPECRQAHDTLAVP